MEALISQTVQELNQKTVSCSLSRQKFYLDGQNTLKNCLAIVEANSQR